ncbi:MAG: hypothetical protein ACRC9U_03390 [Metamycoplasmataceae bacterium]
MYFYKGSIIYNEMKKQGVNFILGGIPKTDDYVPNELFYMGVSKNTPERVSIFKYELKSIVLRTGSFIENFDKPLVIYSKIIF